MTFKNYVKQLNAFLKDNPESADKETRYATDDEGNGYGEIYYSPSKANFIKDDYPEDEVLGNDYNSVIIN